MLGESGIQSQWILRARDPNHEGLPSVGLNLSRWGCGMSHEGVIK